MPLDVAFVQPERKFINVPAKMLRTRVMVDADQPALQDRENALDAVGRYVVADEFGSAVVDGFMIEEQTSEATVSRELVGVQRRAGLDVPMDCAMNGGLVGAFDRHRNRPAAALAHAKDRRLADRAAPRLQLLVLVFVGLDAADIGFVDLDDAGELLVIRAAGFAQPLQQKPCRFLGDPDFLGELYRRDALPRRDEQVRRVNPLVQRDMPAVIERARPHREIFQALVAAVVAALACPDPIASAANRTARAIRPETAFQPYPSCFLIGDQLKKLEGRNGAAAHVLGSRFLPLL